MERNDDLALRTLDGTTQFCIACDTLAGSHHTHSCGERPITAEERAVVEAAMRQEKAAQRAMSSLSHGIKLEYDDACSKTEAACRALRAERSGA